MLLGRKIDLGPGNIVLDGNPALLPKKGHSSPHHLFGQCLLLPNGSMDQDALGAKVGLGPCDTVLDGGPSSPLKRGIAPTFRPTSIVAKRLGGSRCYLVGR